MKTITPLITGMFLLFAVVQSNAQVASNEEEVTLETLIRIADGDLQPFMLSPLRVETANNGFAVKWQTMNENNIAGFELQIGEDKNNFTTVKKLVSATVTQPVKTYVAEFSNTIILSEKVYFRVKTNFNNGTFSYSDLAAVKIRKAK